MQQEMRNRISLAEANSEGEDGFVQHVSALSIFFFL